MHQIIHLSIIEKLFVLVCCVYIIRNIMNYNIVSKIAKQKKKDNICKFLNISLSVLINLYLFSYTQKLENIKLMNNIVRNE